MVSTVCSLNVQLEFEYNEKISPNAPKIGDGLVLLIEIGKFIRLKRVNEYLQKYHDYSKGVQGCTKGTM